MVGRLMRRFAGVVTLLLLGVAPALAQTGTVTGRVTAAGTARPVAGAEVQALAVGGTVAARAMTDADGAFRLVNLTPGTYALTVSVVGYETRRLEAVRVMAGETSMLGVELTEAAFELNPVVVTASKQNEQAIDAPASVAVVSEDAIDARPATSVVDHLRATPGVDIISQGVQATNVATRGFNNIFSGSLKTLTDYRIASVPSLRVNVMHFIPTTSDDLARMELVLGPGSALYGPNTASGVLHMITKSPLVDQGTSVSVMGGERGLFQGTLRSSHQLGESVGLKVSGQYLQADEWVYVDPVEVSEQVRFQNPVFQQNMASALGISLTEAQRRIRRIGQRDYDIARWSGEARLDWQATEQLSTAFTGGMTNAGSGIELTGLGAAQVSDWRYSFVQARANAGSLFLQGYINFSDAGDTYLLRNGAPIVDKSKLYVGQAQHSWTLGERQTFTYGGDALYTVPETEGTINGIYEDDDETTELGAYLQSETQLTDRFKLIFAGRVDDHSALPDLVFSPRAAVVFKPAAEQAFRLTYNRAFSTPTSLNQFLDLGTAIPDAGAAALGYSVRVQGTGDRGFQFGEPGTYRMRSPFTPAAAGGPTSLLPASAVLMWDAAVEVVARSANLPASLVAYMKSIDPTEAQVPTAALVNGAPVKLSGVDIPDIEAIRESTTTTFEAGYKGVLMDRMFLSADLWYTINKDFVTPLTVFTPLLTMSGPELGAYLVPRLMAAGVSQAQAQAIAVGMASVPVGVISSEQVNSTGAQLLATYTNVDDEMKYWGSDLAAQFLLTDAVSLTGTASFVSDEYFDTDVGIVTLNAPTTKFSLGTTYRSPDLGFTGEARVRYNNEFPVQSGVYTGTQCIEEVGGTDPCVDSFTLFDLTLGYEVPTLPGTVVQLNVTNLFDEEYVSYPGTPTIGRLAMLRLRYSF